MKSPLHFKRRDRGPQTPKMGHPAHPRPSLSHQHLEVEGRRVQDDPPVVQHIPDVLDEGYGTYATLFHSVRCLCV